MVFGVVSFRGSIWTLMSGGDGCPGRASIGQTVMLLGSIRLSLLCDRLLFDVGLERHVRWNVIRDVDEDIVNLRVRVGTGAFVSSIHAGVIFVATHVSYE